MRITLAGRSCLEDRAQAQRVLVGNLLGDCHRVSRFECIDVMEIADRYPHMFPGEARIEVAAIIVDRPPRVRLELRILTPNPGFGNVARRLTFDLR